MFSLDKFCSLILKNVINWITSRQTLRQEYFSCALETYIIHIFGLFFLTFCTSFAVRQQHEPCRAGTREGMKIGQAQVTTSSIVNPTVVIT